MHMGTLGELNEGKKWEEEEGVEKDKKKRTVIREENEEKINGKSEMGRRKKGQNARRIRTK